MAVDNNGDNRRQIAQMNYNTYHDSDEKVETTTVEDDHIRADLHAAAETHYPEWGQDAFVFVADDATWNSDDVGRIRAFSLKPADRDGSNKPILVHPIGRRDQLVAVKDCEIVGGDA